MNKRAIIIFFAFAVVCLTLSVNNLQSEKFDVYQQEFMDWLFSPKKQSEMPKPKHHRLSNVIKFRDKNDNGVSYDRIGTANWAKDHTDNPLKGFAWCGTNDKGEPDGSADCVNLSSQSLHFGGGLPYSDEWHGGPTEVDCTVDWVSTPDFANYLKNKGYASILGNASPSGYTLPNLENAQEGDLLQWYDPTNGWHHTAVITKVDDNGNISYSEHSPSHYDKSLSTIWPTNVETGQPGEPYRLIQIGQDANGKIFGTE